MRYRTLDSEGDYTLGVKNNFVKDLEATKQAVQTKLTLLQGEWWENIEEGTPMFQHILGVSGSQENLQSIDLLLQERIISVVQVTSIENFESSYIDRKYTATCSVNTIYGQFELEVPL